MQSKSGPKGDDGISELDTGQAWIPEVSHLTQGTQQISRFKSQA